MVRRRWLRAASVRAAAGNNGSECYWRLVVGYAAASQQCGWAVLDKSEATTIMLVMVGAQTSAPAFCG